MYPAGHGSAQALYYLGRKSGAILGCHEAALTRQRNRIRRWGVGEAQHVIASNQFLIDFIAAIERGPESKLVDFRTELELRRMFVGREFSPDGWISWDSCGKRYGCFLELDRGSEPAKVLSRKFLAYEAYARAGTHKEMFNLRAFRVLVVATSASRTRNLRRLATQGSRLFLFSEFDNCRLETIFSRIWQRAGDEDRIGCMEA
jgi:hypothetical protein